MTERPIRDELRPPLDDAALDRVWGRLEARRRRRPAVALALAAGAAGVLAWQLWPAPPVAVPAIGLRAAPPVRAPAAVGPPTSPAERAPAPGSAARVDTLDPAPAPARRPPREDRRAVRPPDPGSRPASDGTDDTDATDAIPRSDAIGETPGPAPDAIAAALGLVERGEPTAALAALRDRPPLPTARALLAEQPALAAALLQDALDRGHPPGPAIDVLLADAYAAAGDRPRASRAARRALRAAPDGPDAPRMRHLAVGDR